MIRLEQFRIIYFKESGILFPYMQQGPGRPRPRQFPRVSRGFSGRGFRSPEVGDSGIRFRKISRKFLSMLRSKNARFSISVGENRGECRISPGKYDFLRRYLTFPEFPRIPGFRDFPAGIPGDQGFGETRGMSNISGESHISPGIFDIPGDFCHRKC